MNAPLGILSTLLFLRYLHTYKELLTEEKVQMLSRLCTWESWKSSKWSQKCTQNCIKNYSLICVWIFPVFKIVFKIDFEIITKIVPKNVPKFSPKLFDLYILYVDIMFTLYISGTKNFSQREKFRKPLNAVKTTWESWKSWKSLFLIGTMKWLQLLCAVVCGHFLLERIRIANHYIGPQNCQKFCQTFSSKLTPELT